MKKFLTHWVNPNPMGLSRLIGLLLLNSLADWFMSNEIQMPLRHR